MFPGFMFQSLLLAPNLSPFLSAMPPFVSVRWRLMYVFFDPPGVPVLSSPFLGAVSRFPLDRSLLGRYNPVTPPSFQTLVASTFPVDVASPIR